MNDGEPVLLHDEIWPVLLHDWMMNNLSFWRKYNWVLDCWKIYNYGKSDSYSIFIWKIWAFKLWKELVFESWRIKTFEWWKIRAWLENWNFRLMAAMFWTENLNAEKFVFSNDDYMSFQMIKDWNFRWKLEHSNFGKFELLNDVKFELWIYGQSDHSNFGKFERLW